MSNLTYKRNMSRAEFSRFAWSLFYPFGVFLFGVFVISDFAAFGTKLICPLSAAMWITGFVIAFLMPSMRREIISQTVKMNLLYYATLYGLKIVIGMVSGVSAEMIAASYDFAIPTSTGNAVPGYLQNILYFTSVLTPASFVAMQVKRLSEFSKNSSLQKSFGRARSVRNSGKEHTRLTR